MILWHFLNHTSRVCRNVCLIRKTRCISKRITFYDLEAFLAHVSCYIFENKSEFMNQDVSRNQEIYALKTIGQGAYDWKLSQLCIRRQVSIEYIFFRFFVQLASTIKFNLISGGCMEILIKFMYSVRGHAVGSESFWMRFDQTAKITILQKMDIMIN